MAGIPDAEGRRTVRRFLRQLFETYGVQPRALTKKPLKDALKVLQEYEAFASDYVMATVIQRRLGGHAIPHRQATRRALERLGDRRGRAIPDLRAVLERAVPKNRGAEFVDLIEDLAHDTCVEGEPDCPRCELRKICPHALNRKHHAADAASRAAKGAPRREGEGGRAGQGHPGREAGPRPAPGQGPRRARRPRAKDAAAAKPPRGKRGTKYEPRRPAPKPAAPAPLRRQGRRVKAPRRPPRRRGRGTPPEGKPGLAKHDCSPGYRDLRRGRHPRPKEARIASPFGHLSRVFRKITLDARLPDYNTRRGDRISLIRQSGSKPCLLNRDI